jgi:hypothetical protein
MLESLIKGMLELIIFGMSIAFRCPKERGLITRELVQHAVVDITMVAWKPCEAKNSIENLTSWANEWPRFADLLPGGGLTYEGYLRSCRITFRLDDLPKEGAFLRCGCINQVWYINLHLEPPH